MRLRHRIVEVPCDALVKVVVLLLRDLPRPPEPDGLVLVDELPVLHCLGHLLHLLVALLVLFIAVGDLLHDGLLVPRKNVEVDKLRKPLQKRRDPLVLEELLVAVLDVQHDLGAALSEVHRAVLFDRVRRCVLRHPLQRRRIRLSKGLCVHGDLVCDEKGGVEADTKLSNERCVCLALAESLHKLCRSGGGDASQVLNELLLRHSDASVLDGEHRCVLVRLYSDVELHVLAVVGQLQKAALVARVRCVGDQLAQKDLLVGVEGVDDQVHHPRGLRLELVLLGLI
mmetsp:Transcript_4114/g.12369  ORF Transcript_4114/g.12369 Transcript_4114/m.12369 type:complete len:284 (-) Transcript_4114:233-1084(-)